MIEYDLWLGLLEIPNSAKLNLFKYFKSSKNIYEADSRAISDSGICDIKAAEKITLGRDKLSLFTIRDLERKNIKFISINDEAYPEILKNIYNPPFGLFYMGTFPKSFDYSIAVIGARHCSVYGQGMAAELSGAVAGCGGTIISGMARGIDTIAHIGAINNRGATLGILGCGVDVCYPKENHRVYHDIIKNGCVISELPPKTPPLPCFFPMRNRIISGLSRAVIVVEAAKKSGSLITADFALEYGREVFALPGRTTDRLSYGSNRLIEQGAGIITSVGDLIKTLFQMKLLPNRDFALSGKSKANAKGIIRSLNDKEKLLLEKIEYNPVGIDMLIYETGMDLTELLGILDSLEDKEIIKQENGMYFLNTVNILI